MLPEAPTTRDLAESFAAVSRRLVETLEAGDVPLALRWAAERGELLEALNARGELDVVSAALVADGHRTGNRALELAGQQAEVVRGTLESLSLGRSGMNAYRPTGTDGSGCDMTR
jgi:hypothetical protein